MVAHLKKLVILAVCLSLLNIVLVPNVLFSQKHISKGTFDEASCNIPVLDPWDKTLLPAVTKERIPFCKSTPELTYIDGDYLKVNLTLLNSKYGDTTCKYQIVQRPDGTDNNVYLSKPLKFQMQKGVKIENEFIKVSCYKGKNAGKLAYRKYHVVVGDNRKDALVEEHTKEKDEYWNVIILGADSMSLSASMRYLPKTRKYLLDTLGAVEMLGYTRVGLSTYLNMIAFYIGLHEEEMPDPIYGPYDELPGLIKSFAHGGYKTLFAEDDYVGAVFNYVGKGFRQPPTDHYFRPMSLAMNRGKDLPYKGCEKATAESRLILDYLAKFVAKHQNRQPFFGLAYLSILSHDDQRGSRHLDQLYSNLFSYLDKLDIWDNTALLLFGDHGARFGSMTTSKVGRQETNLPMMYLALPRKFRQKYPHLYGNLRANRQRLTSHFDTHQTLMHILSLSRNVALAPAHHGISLLSEIPMNRSCQTAAIPLNFCECYHERIINANNTLVHQGALFLVNNINTMLTESHENCAHLQLSHISSAVVIISHENVKLYRIIFTTKPGRAKFQGTISLNQQNVNNGASDDVTTARQPTFKQEGPISRLNRYGIKPHCVKVPLHWLYCSCKK